MKFLHQSNFKVYGYTVPCEDCHISLKLWIYNTCWTLECRQTVCGWKVRQWCLVGLLWKALVPCLYKHNHTLWAAEAHELCLHKHCHCSHSFLKPLMRCRCFTFCSHTACHCCNELLTHVGNLVLYSLIWEVFLSRWLDERESKRYHNF